MIIWYLGPILSIFYARCTMHALPPGSIYVVVVIIIEKNPFYVPSNNVFHGIVNGIFCTAPKKIIIICFFIFFFIIVIQ